MRFFVFSALLCIAVLGAVYASIGIDGRFYVFLYNPHTQNRVTCGHKTQEGSFALDIAERDDCVGKYTAAGYRELRSNDTLPDGFVHLIDIVPTAVQDMRYATAHNFTGAVVPGYDAGACILTRQAAGALAAVQATVRAKGFTLIVWDCYRPAQAVASFVTWAKGPEESAKAEFYPRVPKSELFERGYIASHSRHSSGSTVDLGLAPLGTGAAPQWQTGMTPVDCTAPFGTRFTDGALDFGTGYDCFDGLAHGDAAVSATAAANRATLRDAMIAAGFEPYAEEWWHFTLKNERFKGQAFDFPVR